MHVLANGRTGTSNKPVGSIRNRNGKNIEENRNIRIHVECNQNKSRFFCNMSGRTERPTTFLECKTDELFDWI